MRPIMGLWLAFALLAPAVADAGQIYGTIVSEGQGLKGVTLAIQCGKDEPVTGSTGSDGSYRINVPQQGQCTLALPSYGGRPSAVVFSSPNPSLYNFELAKLGDGKFALRRR
jgi:hypothetical protein